MIGDEAAQQALGYEAEEDAFDFVDGWAEVVVGCQGWECWVGGLIDEVRIVLACREVEAGLLACIVETGEIGVDVAGLCLWRAWVGEDAVCCVGKA